MIIQTSQGLSQYVLKCYDKPEEAKNAGCVISFDARYNSEKWAKLTARVFSKAGYRVYLFNTITPTPFVPFTVQRKKAAVGIMITASHNPKEDNVSTYSSAKSSTVSNHSTSLEMEANLPISVEVGRIVNKYTLSIFYKQQFISNKLEIGQIFRKNKQLTGHFLKK